MCHFNKVLIAVFLICGNVIAGQDITDPLNNNQPTKPINLAGPRFGFTMLTGESAEKLKDEYDASPLITQFGWQYETRFFTVENGLHGVTEFVGLVGGMEKGLFLPSLSFLAGIRTAEGIEFGVGPNVSLSGTAYAIAGGVTAKSGSLNFPINLSVVLSKKGTRVSLLLGFNMASY